MQDHRKYRFSAGFPAWPSGMAQAGLDRLSRPPQKRRFMKVDFLSLFLLLSLGLAGCGSDTPEQNAD
ncbi:MAG: hypothetical protein QF721_01360, partial [Verrucomicrobiota bacterium]|nr:hypothetical protein [Verrucomicrobiota bacterium]